MLKSQDGNWDGKLTASLVIYVCVYVSLCCICVSICVCMYIYTYMMQPYADTPTYTHSTIYAKVLNVFITILRILPNKIHSVLSIHIKFQRPSKKLFIYLVYFSILEAQIAPESRWWWWNFWPVTRQMQLYISKIKTRIIPSSPLFMKLDIEKGVTYVRENHALFVKFTSNAFKVMDLDVKGQARSYYMRIHLCNKIK